MKFLIRDALNLLRKWHTRIEPCCLVWVTGHPPGLLARLRTTTHEIWNNNTFMIITFLYLKTPKDCCTSTSFVKTQALFSPKALCYKAWSTRSDVLFLRTQEYLPVFTEDPGPVFIQRPGQIRPSSQLKTSAYLSWGWKSLSARTDLSYLKTWVCFPCFCLKAQAIWLCFHQRPGQIRPSP